MNKGATRPFRLVATLWYWFFTVGNWYGCWFRLPTWSFVSSRVDKLPHIPTRPSPLFICGRRQLPSEVTWSRAQETCFATWNSRRLRQSSLCGIYTSSWSPAAKHLGCPRMTWALWLYRLPGLSLGGAGTTRNLLRWKSFAVDRFAETSQPPVLKRRAPRVGIFLADYQKQ